MPYLFNEKDVYDFSAFIGADVREKRGELFFKSCPRCGGGNGKDVDTFSVNLETGCFKCFRASCDYHGHFVELARDFGYQLDFGEPKVYRTFRQREIEVRPNAIKYLEGRCIDREVIERYKVTTRSDNQSVIAFPFFDDQNILQFLKYRNIHPKPKQSKEWCEKDTKPILFGMAQCEDFETLIVTEGQIDSLSVATCGIKNAVSVPTGALGFTWLPFCYEWVSKFKEVIVFGDYERGKMTLIDTLMARLPQKVKGVRPCDYLGEKDANAILQKYGKNAIVAAIQNAEVPQLSNVKDLSMVKSVDINALPKIYTNIRAVDRVIGGLILGQVVLLTGKCGDGKSTFMSQLVCEALEQNENVFVYSGELADYHFKRWLDYQLAGSNYIIQQENAFGEKEYMLTNPVVDKITNWYKGRAYIYDNNYIPDDKAELESVSDTIEKAVRQYNVKMVCVDNLMTAMDVVERQDNLYLTQSNFVGRLKKIAVKYNVVIVLVAHPRKSSNDFSNDDVSGSADITNKVDLVMSYKRREDPDGQSAGQLLVTKNRLTGRLAVGNGAINLLYSEATKRIFGEGSEPRNYSWQKATKDDYFEISDVL